jgi:2',3'-cyclic-nucleotide 2'-phosphodiesterase (5'-nucleotidase family)
VITDAAGNAFGGIAQNDLDFTVAAGQQNYRLQLLHFSDGEASLLATKTAKNLAAMVDAFEDQYANTLVLSGGDNFLAGPFLAAVGGLGYPSRRCR